MSRSCFEPNSGDTTPGPRCAVYLKVVAGPAVSRRVWGEEVRVMSRSVELKIILVLLACLAPVAARPAERPLSKDDVTLLLIGGASPEKMVEIIEKRGVDFQMNPDLAKKFHDEGA